MDELDKDFLKGLAILVFGGIIVFNVIIATIVGWRLVEKHFGIHL